MNLTFTLSDEFGSFCADGEKAAQFRFERVDPFAAEAEQISFDFAGVRNASSSFCNALVANLISQTGGSVVQKLRFTNCRDNVRAVVEAAVELGLARAAKEGRSPDRMTKAPENVTEPIQEGHA